jgi:membrane fusion protein (multidrug efflux system)
MVFPSRNPPGTTGLIELRIALAIVFVVVLAGVGVFLVLGHNPAEEPVPDSAEAQAPGEAEGQADAPSGAAPIPVAVHVLTEGRAEGAIRVWGTIHPRQEASVLADLSGRVDAVHVALGDAVTKGQVLLEIDPDLYLARVDEAESKLESAKLAEEKGRKDYERSEAMFANGTVSDSEHEGVRNRLAVVKALRAEAAATLAQARSNLAGARLRAPFDGHVGSRPPDVGSSVTIGMPLIRLVDIHSLRVEAQLSEQDLGRIHTGALVSLSVEALPGASFTGTVSAIGPQTDAETKQFPVEIRVANPSGHPLRAGMVARVRIVYEAHDRVPLLPVDALVEADGGYVFFTVENGAAHRRTLVAGPRQGQRIAVLEGAAAGDSVVVLGQLRLDEGTPVSVEEVN